jgi:hypothetical protein
MVDTRAKKRSGEDSHQQVAKKSRTASFTPATMQRRIIGFEADAAYAQGMLSEAWKNIEREHIALAAVKQTANQPVPASQHGITVRFERESELSRHIRGVQTRPQAPPAPQRQAPQRQQNATNPPEIPRVFRGSSERFGDWCKSSCSWVGRKPIHVVVGTAVMMIIVVTMTTYGVYKSCEGLFHTEPVVENVSALGEVRQATASAVAWLATLPGVAALSGAGAWLKNMTNPTVLDAASKQAAEQAAKTAQAKKQAAEQAAKTAQAEKQAAEQAAQAKRQVAEKAAREKATTEERARAKARHETLKTEEKARATTRHGTLKAKFKAARKMESAKDEANLDQALENVLAGIDAEPAPGT